MDKRLLYLIEGILLISLVSAQSVSISPSNIALGNIFPNENYTQNLTISSDGIYAIILNSSNPNIIIYPPQILSDGTNNQSVQINISASSNISSGNIDFDINSNLNELEVPTIVYQSSGGGNPYPVYVTQNNTQYFIINHTQFIPIPVTNITINQTTNTTCPLGESLMSFE